MPASPDIRAISRDSAPKGATLLELLVSVSVLVIVVLFLSQMLTQAGFGWSRGEARKEQLQTARAIFSSLENDLQATLLPVNRSNARSLQFFINQSGGAAPYSVPAEYRNHDAVFFQASISSNSASDVAEVGYFVRWDISNPAAPRSLLCRFFASAADPDFLIYTNPSGWISDEIIERGTPAVVDNANPDLSYKGLLAENVLGLWIRPLDPLGQPILQNNQSEAFDSRSGYTYSGNSGPVTKPGCALPSALEVSFVLIASEFAKRIGPAEMAAITWAAQNSASAQLFVEHFASDSSLKKLNPGIRVFRSTILLRNAQ